MWTLILIGFLLLFTGLFFWFQSSAQIKTTEQEFIIFQPCGVNQIKSREDFYISEGTTKSNFGVEDPKRYCSLRDEGFSLIPEQQRTEEIIKQYLYTQKQNDSQINQQDLTHLTELLSVQSTDEVSQFLYGLLQKYIQRLGLHSTDTPLERRLKLFLMKNPVVTNDMIDHLAEHHQIPSEKLKHVLDAMLIRSVLHFQN